MGIEIPFFPGSPPHGRGIEIKKSTARENWGITPAWAGNRTRLHVAQVTAEGSPPHGRGIGVNYPVH